GERDASGVDKTTIRISGEKPAAERVTIDTSVPTPPAPVAAVPAAEPSAVERSVAQSDAQNEAQEDKSRREALARMDDAQAAAPVAAPV
ncbi:hypothetical protein, partial [Stenotrophomonas maltophilia]|uniref:hypothetical protein n=1 Tax=Stenotrophomonas maltophilia TaxID=40324 RepID=UPI003CCFE085